MVEFELPQTQCNSKEFTNRKIVGNGERSQSRQISQHPIRLLTVSFISPTESHKKEGSMGYSQGQQRKTEPNNIPAVKVCHQRFPRQKTLRVAPRERNSIELPKASLSRTGHLELSTSNPKTLDTCSTETTLKRSNIIAWPNAELLSNTLGIRISTPGHYPKSAIPYGRRNRVPKSFCASPTIAPMRSIGQMTNRMLCRDAIRTSSALSTNSFSTRASMDSRSSLTVMDITQTAQQLLDRSKTISVHDRTHQSRHHKPLLNQANPIRRTMRTIDRNVEQWMDGLIDIRQASANLMMPRHHGLVRKPEISRTRAPSVGHSTTPDPYSTARDHDQHDPIEDILDHEQQDPVEDIPDHEQQDPVEDILDHEQRNLVEDIPDRDQQDLPGDVPDHDQQALVGDVPDHEQQDLVGDVPDHDQQDPVEDIPDHAQHGRKKYVNQLGMVIPTDDKGSIDNVINETIRDEYLQNNNSFEVTEDNVQEEAAHNDDQDDTSNHTGIEQNSSIMDLPMENVSKEDLPFPDGNKDL